MELRNKIIFSLIFPISVMLLTGCKKKETTFPQEPSRDVILQKAWSNYDKGNFDIAEVWFDSLITLDLQDREALVGKGYTLLEKEEYDLGSALSYFSLILALDGVSLTEETFKEVATVVTDSGLPYGATWAIKTNKRNILWVSNVIEAPAGVHKPFYFDDTLVYFNDDIPDTVVYIDYVTYVPQIPPDEVFLWAWAGIGFIYLAQDKNELASEYLYSLAKRSRGFYFPHYPFIKFTNIIGAAAYAYFKEGLYGNAVEVLKLSGWNDYPSNPFDPASYLKILLKIEELMND